VTPSTEAFRLAGTTSSDVCLPSALPSRAYGNILVTIDALGSTIANNVFSGFTTVEGLRFRGPSATVTGNQFDNSRTGNTAGGSFQLTDGSYSGNVFTGHDGRADAFAGANTMTGAGGKDTLFGGPGVDQLTAAPATTCWLVTPAPTS